MIKVENIEVFGFKAALRGMRNPMNSWDKADSVTFYNHMFGRVETLIGPNDLDLCKRLIKAGVSHRKFLRMIHVQCDITAPLRWWKDYDTYKVSTVANSCSTMHKIHDRDFARDDFSTDESSEDTLLKLDSDIEFLNRKRKEFIESDKTDRLSWKALVDELPSSYLQKRTIDINYETALAIALDRKYHKQYEFRTLCDIMLTDFPYFKMFYESILEEKRKV